jgi:hypothetical protein
MNRFKNLQRSALFSLVCALFFLPLLVVHGQDLQTITATKLGSVMAQGTQEPQLITAYNDEMLCGLTDQKLRRYINIYNVGTEGGVDFSQAVFGYQSFNHDLETGICTPDAYTELYGTFTGGSNGTLTFPTPNDVYVTTCQVMDGKSIECNFVMESLNSTWRKVFTIENPEAFKPPVQITSEYIFTKYGIRVEDSFGGDEYDQTAWSDHELSLLNDVLKELPPGFLNHIALTRIVRNKVSIDADGNPKPGTCGAYFRCEEKTDPKCTGSLTTIRIFDSAATALPDFPNDPDKQFKSTILHEITHAYQTYKDGNSIYIDSNKSPLSVNYKDATRPDTTLEAVRNGGWEENGWGWYPVVGWYLYGAPGNWPPTNYGRTKPGEDMSESVKMYVYDPQRLQTSSMQRYNFIKDQMFGGIEYENGIQKKP